MLIIDKNNFLGEGLHKRVYVHPADEHKCIKVMKDEKDAEIQRELGYYKTLKLLGKHPSMMAEYYGEVETNLGQGYCFERVLDYDGCPSRTLSAIFKDKAAEEEILGCSVEAVLLKFKQLLMEEKIVVSNIDPYNFMIQRLNAEEYTIRVIDNIGSPVHVPLSYYFDFVAKMHVKKYWLRFIEKYSSRYPNIMTSNLIRLLKE